MITELIPFAEALRSVQDKSILPTSLSSADLMGIRSDILKRATFSARTTNAGYVQKIDDIIETILNPKNIPEKEGDLAHAEGMDIGTGRAELKKALDSIDYQPAKPGTIEDLGSDQRLDLIIKTNVDMAAGYGGHVQAMDDDVIDAYPAQELFRAEYRMEPRDWPAKWTEAGGQMFEGRMIALKNSPIWESISAFGLPYPPYDFNSGMWTRDVDRDESVRLGLISPTEEINSTFKPFNEDLQSSPDIRSAELRRVLEEDGYRFDGDVLTI